MARAQQSAGDAAADAVPNGWKQYRVIGAAVWLLSCRHSAQWLLRGSERTLEKSIYAYSDFISAEATPMGTRLLEVTCTSYPLNGRYGLVLTSEELAPKPY